MSSIFRGGSRSALRHFSDGDRVMIEQRQLGSTGLYVARLALLGMMSFGDASRRQWVLDETAAEPIVCRAARFGRLQ